MRSLAGLSEAKTTFCCFHFCANLGKADKTEFFEKRTCFIILYLDHHCLKLNASFFRKELKRENSKVALL